MRLEVDLELGMLAVPYIHTATPDQVRRLISDAWSLALRTQPPEKFGQKVFGACHYGAQGSVAGSTTGSCRATTWARTSC